MARKPKTRTFDVKTDEMVREAVKRGLAPNESRFYEMGAIRLAWRDPIVWQIEKALCSGLSITPQELEKSLFVDFYARNQAFVTVYGDSPEQMVPFTRAKVSETGAELRKRLTAHYLHKFIEAKMSELLAKPVEERSPAERDWMERNQIVLDEVDQAQWLDLTSQ